MTGPDADALRIREAVRAIVLDPDDRILLVQFRFPATGEHWALPGGGLEPGESDHQALHRELTEEVGLTGAHIGPHVWDRLHVIPFINGLWDGQRERIYLVRTESFAPQPRLSWEALNTEYVFDLRWWHLDELDHCPQVVPHRLTDHLRNLLRDGPPNGPVDVGV
jgi:8-oxo-dGTP pyrophosphatase MutT (NUDIX family)